MTINKYKLSNASPNANPTYYYSYLDRKKYRHIVMYVYIYV